MEMNLRGRFVRSGKVKDIYEVDAGHLLFHFTDRVSAFDVILPTAIPRKGRCSVGSGPTVRVARCAQPHG